MRTFTVSLNKCWCLCWVDEAGMLAVQIGPVVFEWDHSTDESRA